MIQRTQIPTTMITTDYDYYCDYSCCCCCCCYSWLFLNRGKLAYFTDVLLVRLVPKTRTFYRSFPSSNWQRWSKHWTRQCHTVLHTCHCVSDSNNVQQKWRQNKPTYSMSVSEHSRPSGRSVRSRHVLHGRSVCLRCRWVGKRHRRRHVRIASHQLQHTTQPSLHWSQIPGIFTNNYTVFPLSGSFFQSSCRLRQVPIR